MNTRVIATNAGPLAWHLLGDAAPRLAVLPGWGLNVPFLRTTAFWAPWEAWAASHPLLMLDRRGTGDSRANRGDAGPEQLAADLIAALDTADIPTVALWAQADATCAAVALFMQHPGRIERLVLQAPFAQVLATPGASGGMALDAMLRLAMLDPTAPVLDDLDTLGAIAGTEGDALTRLTETLVPGFLPRLMSDITAVDLRPVLPAIRVPTLILHGSADRVIAPTQTDEVARLIPTARLQRVEGMGHVMRAEDLPGVFAVVEEFLGA